ncbi:hypothetical protein B0H14DRAFT_2422185, partial [Mycena olivaceomarginata]
TVRRHLQKYHKPEYQKWAKENNFESRLPDDMKERAEAAAAAAADKAWLHQQTLDPHLREKADRPVPYSDDVFTEAALEWLIATNQPVNALAHAHPKFKIMIDIAARATEDVVLPNEAQTREKINNLFFEQMNLLKIRLQVSVQPRFRSSHLTFVVYRATPLRG